MRGEESCDKCCRRKKKDETIKGEVEMEREREEMVGGERRLGGMKKEKEKIKAGEGSK